VSISQRLDELTLRARARVGQVLKDKWRLDELLGVGGMASVYAATHRNASRVAVKMLHVELSLDPSIRARFQREGYLANTVGHPGAVRVLDDDVADDGSVFLVMELLEGETVLARWIRKGRTLPAEEVVSVTDQLLDVLAAAHARGTVHRDIKPENIFLTRDGLVKVLDFGIARVQELASGSGATKLPSVVEVVDRALAFEKADRWPTAEAMQEAVGRVLREQVAARTLGRAAPARRVGPVVAPSEAAPDALPETEPDPRKGDRAGLPVALAPTLAPALAQAANPMLALRAERGRGRGRSIRS
jgi:eukaryotic-like serine/threonine-protein kinase